VGRGPRTQVQYYDGQRWQSFTFQNYVQHLCESPKHGVLFYVQGGNFYTYDNGQMQYVSSTGDHTRWLWGSRLLQPYEPALLEAHPKDYVLVERSEKAPRGFLVRAPDGSGVADGLTPDFQRGDELPQYPSTLTRGFYGGHWTDGTYPICRVFGDRIIPCSWKNTPALARAYNLRQVIEDRAHNLWFYPGPLGRQVLCKHVDGFAIRVTKVTTEVKDEAAIDVEVAEDWADERPIRLYWRVDGGRWEGGDVGQSVTVPLPEPGRHRVEILGMGPQGETTPEPVQCSIFARGARP